MGKSTRLLGLLALLLTGALGTAASPLIIKRDGFSAGAFDPSFWLGERGSLTLHDLGGKLYLIRTQNYDTAHAESRVASFLRSEDARHYDIRVTARVPHKLAPPTGAAGDLLALGLGFYANDNFGHYMELVVEDASTGRRFALNYYNGMKLYLKTAPYPAEAGDKVILRIFKAANGLFKFAWQKPGDTGWHPLFELGTSSVTELPGPASLRPYLRGTYGRTTRCPTFWNVSLDDFTILYQRTAN
jgi:hypothetical protein